MTPIHKMRREWFGGLVYSENPGFTAFVDAARADALGIPDTGAGKTGRFSAPLDVHVSITTRCNLHCRGCYALHPEAPAGDMPLDLARTIIDRLSKMNVFTIALGGGEPFLHPQLFDIATCARQAGIVPNITTNGLLLDLEMAAKCRIFGSVHVSCHHPAELPRLEDPVRRLKNAGVDVGLNILVSNASFAALPHIWDWCAAQGLSRALLLKFKLTANNPDCRDLILSPPQEQALLPLVRRLTCRHSIMPMLDCSFFPALAFMHPNRRDLEFFDLNGCVGGNAILAITTNGHFKPCSFCDTTCGDARNLSRMTWAENTALEDFRQRRIQPGCRACTHEDLCNGGCRISNTPWCATAPNPKTAALHCSAK